MGFVYAGRHSGEVRCDRCNSWATKHRIPGVNPSPAVKQAISNLKGIRIAHAVKKHESELSGTGMLGALIAKPANGVSEIKLMAFSGSAEKHALLNKWLPSGWIIANVLPPAQGKEWNDIYGKKFTMPGNLPFQQGTDENKACAAMKLLLTLGQIYKTKGCSRGYNSLTFYEEDVAASSAAKITNFRKMSDKMSYGSVSCDACEIRLPLMLCDAAA